MFSCFSCARCKTPPQDEIRSTSSLLHHPSHSSLLNYMNNFDVQGNLTTVLPSRENIGNELIVIDYPCPSELKPHVEGRRKSKKEGTIKCVNDSSIPPVKISFISKRSDNYFIIDKQKKIQKNQNHPQNQILKKTFHKSIVNFSKYVNAFTSLKKTFIQKKHHLLILNLLQILLLNLIQLFILIIHIKIILYHMKIIHVKLK